MIHSLDRIDLAKEISKRAMAIGKRMPVLIEINIGKEADKGGVMPDDTEALVREAAKLQGLDIRGLMTMAPAGISSEDYKRYFSETKKIFDRIASLKIEGVKMETLSMGMSESYTEAAETGATLVRVGSAVFGKRMYQTENKKI
jgi:pyridoxal phosphate enzyme (YggS family)